MPESKQVILSAACKICTGEGYSSCLRCGIAVRLKSSIPFSSSNEAVLVVEVVACRAACNSEGSCDLRLPLCDRGVPELERRFVVVLTLGDAVAV